MSGVGHVNQLLGPWRHLVRPEPVEKVGWGRGSGMCRVTLGLEGGKQREEKSVRASRGANLPIWQQGVTALRRFISRLLPGLKPAVWLVRFVTLRALTGPGGQPIAVSWHPTLFLQALLYPAAGGQEGEGCPGSTSHFQLSARKG